MCVFEAQAKELVATADTDGDGRVSLSEFALAVLFGAESAAPKAPARAR